MTFKKLADRLYITTNGVAINGRTYHFRIDGRNNSGYRVDVMRPLIPVWEAIDGGEAVKFIKHGKSLCEAFRFDLENN